jgi:hypothetical protein
MCKKLMEKEEIENHLIAINVVQFSYAGCTPFGYMPLGKDLGHTVDLPTVYVIYNVTLDREALNDEAINTIDIQLIKHPAIQQTMLPIVKEQDFKSALKCVPEKTVSSYSRQGVNHCKACLEGSQDVVADLVATVHAAMMTVPSEVAFCPYHWKQSVDVMIEKICGVARSNKLRIIQLLKVDLNQVLRITHHIRRNASQGLQKITPESSQSTSIFGPTRLV